MNILNQPRNPDLSFVVPVKDEEVTISELYLGISREVAKLDLQFELIFVDDGSHDSSWTEIEKLSECDPRVKGIRFRRNIGKANALTAGFSAAKGDIVFTMDADLQDDPKEIGRFLEKLNEGYDIVSGWKKTRHDPWHKVLPSRVFNAMISRLIGVHLHDHNCGFKCYRAEVTKDVSLYGEMHRMVPSLASMRGYKSAEIPVQHHPRLHGKSKYGVKRFLRGFMDLLTVYFLKNFRERPLHLFGGFGISAFLIGLLLLAASALGVGGIVVSSLSSTMMFSSLPLLALGFVSELIVSRRNHRDKYLPISEETPSLKGVIAGAAEYSEELAPKVLVADDDKSIRKLAATHLMRAGFQVIEAADGKDALELMTHDVAIAILDLNMPVMGGLDCMRELKTRFPRTEIVILSGQEDVDDAVLSMKLGAFEYLNKPLQSEQLVGAVCLALQFRSLSNTRVAA